jgi:putative ABC transport system permease protein
MNRPLRDSGTGGGRGGAEEAAGGRRSLGFVRRLRLRAALAMVRTASVFVPRFERADWLEEWRGELHARPATRSFQPLRDAGGAIPDALWHARGDWRLEMMGHDVRFAIRALLARPAFTVTVIVTLALGIGANAVIFSAVDAVVLNPFDFEEPDRIVGVGTIYPRLNVELGFFERLSAPEFADIERGVPAFEEIAAFDMGNRQIIGGDVPQNLFTGFWWNDVLPVLGTRPVLGRGFSREDITGGERVALISHRVWRTRFAADESVVGMTIRIDDEPYTLIGVFPPEAFIYGTDLWMPMWADPDVLPRNRRQFNIVARLAEGATLEEANAQLEALARRTEGEHGAELQEYEGWRLVAQTWTDVNVQTLKPAALILLGAVGFVLLLVCTNVASLLLSRSAGRRREIALRAALGAGRARIVRQLLTESALLALLGGAAGVVLAAVGLRLLVIQLPATLLPTTAELAINGRVVGYTAAISLLAGIVFGLAPALQTSRFERQRTLGLEAAQSTGSRGRRRLQGTFVAVEVALALVLLMGAGLLVNSFIRLNAVEPGIDTDDVLTMRLTLPWNKYDGAAITGFFDELSGRVATIPGVTAVGAGTQLPPSAFSRTQFVPEGGELGDEGSLPTAYVTLADESYFETLGMPVLRGRGFMADDRPDTPMVTVINQTLAGTYYPGVDPIGKAIKIGTPDDDLPRVEIVGVVADTKNRGLGSDTQPELFVSLRQAAGYNNQIFLIVRTAVEPSSVLDDVRAQVAAIDPDQPVYAVQLLNEAFAAQFAVQRFALVMLGAFAAMAMALAAVGIYGVVSYGVADRTREIGVRMALGAGRREVMGLMVRQALVPVAIGLVVGLGLSAGLGIAMSGMLYGTSGADPITLATVGLLLAAIAFASSYLPARRACGLDPVAALRAE